MGPKRAQKILEKSSVVKQVVPEVVDVVVNV